MTIEELETELSNAIDNMKQNWNGNGNIDECFPDIVLIALENFKESIIDYLKSNK